MLDESLIEAELRAVVRSFEQAQLGFESAGDDAPVSQGARQSLGSIDQRVDAGAVSPSASQFRHRDPQRGPPRSSHPGNPKGIAGLISLAERERTMWGRIMMRDDVAGVTQPPTGRRQVDGEQFLFTAHAENRRISAHVTERIDSHDCGTRQKSQYGRSGHRYHAPQRAARL